MRTALLLVHFTIVSQMLGCAFLIGGRGVDFDHVDTQEKVHSKFGPPLSMEVDGETTVETYRTRQKLVSLDRFGSIGGIYYVMGWGATFGTIDLYLFPSELYRWSSGLILGTDVQVTYHNRDVRSLVVNGKEWPLWRQPPSEKTGEPNDAKKPE